MTKKLFVCAVIIGLFGIVGLGRNSFAAGATVDKINESDPVADQLLSNPCDSSGQSDPTVSGIVSETGTIITLPDGSVNANINESFTGTGTDSLGNNYKCGEFIVEHEFHALSSEADVVVFRCTSTTGQGFVVVVRFAELKNHTVDHEKTICL
jgi:hypothetical protein